MMNTSNKDIFDRIMHLPGLRIFESFYLTHKEVLLYLFFGGISFFLNLALFALFTEELKINVLFANAVDWVICVLFQFFTNRTWVFNGKTTTIRNFFWQILSFFGGRLFTLIVEEAILIIFIDKLGYSSITVKLIAQIIVIILNFVISKLIVFKK